MNELKKLIIEFWNYSLGFSTSFDFVEFFNLFTPILKKKLALHGVLTLEDYIEALNDIYDYQILSYFAYISEHTNIKFDANDIIKLILEPRYRAFNHLYRENSNYKKLLSLYIDIQNPINYNVYLVDRCIHAMHNSGFLIDIEGIRNEFENKL